MYLVSNFYKINSIEIENGKHNDKIKEYVEKHKTTLRIMDDVFEIDGIVGQIKNAREDIIFIDFVQNIKGE
jgi:hypothetical protein